MNEPKYKRLLYFISLIIGITLCIQGYWNYKNYLLEKQQFIADVQTSLDAAVDDYYTQLAQQNTVGFISDSIASDSLLTDIEIQKILHATDSFDGNIKKIRISDSSALKGISIFKNSNIDSFHIEINDGTTRAHAINSKQRFNKEGKNKVFQMLTSKIIVSFSQDSLSLGRIDSLIQQELKRKKNTIPYGLQLENHWKEDQKIRPEIIKESSFSATAASSFLTNESDLTMYFNNSTATILRRNSISLLLSLLFAGSIILSLLYLLKIIQKQKQLAEVKNDLISNITHEFKTPIATIGAAMEGIQAFNTENDTQKNLRYSKISSEQVEKLNEMVEKLLETATLDSEKLSLNFEATNLVALLQKASIKEEFASENKRISFNTSEEEIYHSIDVFHFENAINNIIDNAIKYGGDAISVGIKKVKKSIEITIHDTGTSLTETHKKQIFEKFYRVPKGNTHDIKGFGIGLYYAKKIIEGHQGCISLLLDKQTTFKITLPDAT